MKEKSFMILVQVHHDHLRTFFSEIKKHWIGEGGMGGGGRGGNEMKESGCQIKT